MDPKDEPEETTISASFEVVTTSTASRINHDNPSNTMDTSATVTVTVTTTDDDFQWTPTTIAQSIVLFFLAGVAEIVGGWMIWYVFVSI